MTNPLIRQVRHMAHVDFITGGVFVQSRLAVFGDDLIVQRMIWSDEMVGMSEEKQWEYICIVAMTNQRALLDKACYG